MLLGPLALTLFFFTMLYKMDANARDGSLYAAEKQSYLDEMDKYVEARKAYLELVTLQAELKKKQIVESPSSEE
jgi:capsule polysaccharide modification protein KpsS